MRRVRFSHCVPVVAHLEPQQQPATERGETELKFIKALMIAAVLASALACGACQNKAVQTTTTSGKDTGYHK